MWEPYTKKLLRPSIGTSLFTLVLGFSTSTTYLIFGIVSKNFITFWNCSVFKLSIKSVNSLSLISVFCYIVSSQDMVSRQSLTIVNAISVVDALLYVA